MKTHDFLISNIDTDAVAFCKKDQSFFSEEEREQLLEELNSYFPEKIKFADDGYYDKFIVLRAKNYILFQNGKIKKKGSSIKSSKIEKGLSNLMEDIINCLVYDKQDQLLDVYHKYIREVHHLTDISRWTSKKTLTQSVLNPQRSTEQKILDALKGKQLQQGDKIWLYFTEEQKQVEVPINKKGAVVGYKTKTITEYPLKLQENWNNDHSIDKLIAKIYKTLLIFENVINIEQFPKYYLKSKEIKEKLQEIIK